MEHSPSSFVPETSSLPVLVYDGECGFCTWTVDFIRPRLRESVVLVPWQRAELRELGLSEPEAKQSAWWVDGEGKKLRGHRAVARAFRACSQPWRALGTLLEWPLIRALAAAIYQLVSRNRGRLPGTTPALRRKENR